MLCHTQLLKVGSEDRTHILMFVQQALSQLRYLPGLAMCRFKDYLGFSYVAETGNAKAKSCKVMTIPM